MISKSYYVLLSPSRVTPNPVRQAESTVQLVGGSRIHCTILKDFLPYFFLYHGNFFPYPYQPFPQTYQGLPIWKTLPQQIPTFLPQPMPQQETVTDEQMPLKMPQQMPKQEIATDEQMKFKQTSESLTKEFEKKYANLQKQNADPKVLKEAYDEYLQQYGKSKTFFTLKRQIFNIL